MGLFGALVRTTVNVVLLPVTLPIAVAKDAAVVMEGDDPENTSALLREIKRDADEGRD